MKSNNSSEARNIKDRQPFCWQEKEALRVIRKSFEGDAPSALLTYVALTEIASDFGSETFQASASYIGDKARLSRRTITRLIEPLRTCGLIAVKRTKVPGKKEMAPNTYTLLKVVTLFPYGQRSASTLSQNRRNKERKKHILRMNTSSSKMNTLSHSSKEDTRLLRKTRLF